jgi:GrpB-like predicted nucleotidyltransferase (UPF0157 family)
VTDRASDVVPYDPEWPAYFAAERALLDDVLAPWLEGGIHHVGSTAIPGIAAKPMIDMLAGVRDLDAARGAFERCSPGPTSIRRTARESRTTSTGRPTCRECGGTTSI